MFYFLKTVNLSIRLLPLSYPDTMPERLSPLLDKIEIKGTLVVFQSAWNAVSRNNAVSTMTHCM